MECPACGVVNDGSARFCMTCGTALDAPAPPPVLPPPPVVAPPPPAMAPPPPAVQAPPPPPVVAAPPPPQLPPMAPAPVPAGPPPDPNGLGVAATRLSPLAGQASRAAFAVAGAVLEAGERVELVAAGTLEGHAALVLLTDRTILVVDDRPWKPVVERIAAEPPLEVHGWRDDRSARLTFVLNGSQLVVDQILDAALAVELAERIRQRIGS